MKVLITGAANGIGRATAEAFAKKPNTSLVLVDIDATALKKLANSLSCPVLSLSCDLADPAAVESLLASANADGQPLDVLINNAGIMRVGRWDQMDAKISAILLQLDLLTPLRLTQLALADMRARDSGVIVNIASMAGITVTPGCVAYGAAKAGLGHATETLKLELRGTGVRAISVYPGPVETELEKNARAEIHESLATRVLPVGNPAKLAKLICKAVIKGNTDRIIYPKGYGLAGVTPSLVNRALHSLAPQPKH